MQPFSHFKSFSRGAPFISGTRFRGIGITLLSFALLGLLCGCANYRLGTGAPLKFRTLFIAVVESDIILPQTRVLATAKVKEAFIRDTRVSVVDDESKADAILVVRLRSYDREAVVARADDAGLARKFTLRLQALCTLRLRDGQTLLNEKPLRLQRDAYTDSGQLLSERETLPLLLDSLAKDAVRAALDTW